jgi:hypothetical protein
MRVVIGLNLSLGPFGTVWITVVFSSTRTLVVGCHAHYLVQVPVELGGTEYDLHMKLPSAVEELVPDNDLYGGPVNYLNYSFMDRDWERHPSVLQEVVPLEVTIR